MLRNLRMAGQLGCLTPEGLQDMRRGQSPTITLGPYAGDQLSVDHTCPHRYAKRCRRVIPFAVHPEFDKVIANLEWMPLKLNMRKGDAMTARQEALLPRLRAARLP